ncbi:MAG: virulence factor Mce, partial [Aeromicrobium sp.]|nr:virulence factor Mce [Aeromicrobium sp.]
MSISGLAQRFAGLSKLLVAVVALLLLAAVFLVVNNKDNKRYVTVDFEQTNSVYKGSDVKVLGVPIGKVDKLTPRGNVVRVRIAYDSKYRLPTDVKAVVVSPSIVGDRFVQFAPAYNGGAALKNDAFIPVDRTAVPVELDKIYQSLDDLSVALGPRGANKDGALSSVIDDTAKQLDGQGAQLNETLHNFGKLSTTLSNNKDELFGSLREVEDFVSLLKTNDSTVRGFNDSTARVSTVLAGERQDLGATLKALSLALVDVNGLVK